MEQIEFDRQVAGLRDRMFRFACTILQCREEAEDVTHDTLVRLWTRRGVADACRDVESFVMTCVRNGCYDRLRRRRGRMGECSEAMIAEPQSSRSEVCEVVSRAMSALPQKQREVLHLKDIEGYATYEIAQMLSLEENQIRTILSRARKGLREEVIKIDGYGY